MPVLRDAYRAMLRADADAYGVGAAPAVDQWRPIEAAPRDAKVLFWIRPKTEDETWHNTSGIAIKVMGEPHIHEGVYGSWGSLWTATHWMPRMHIEPPKDGVEGGFEWLT